MNEVEETNRLAQADARRPFFLYLLNVLNFLSLVHFAMRRTFMAGAALLLAGAIVARSKTESLLFVFLRIDRKNDIAILRPMIAPDIGVQLDSGSPQLAPGTVLTCEMVAREHDAIVEGQVGKVAELVLDCGDHKFVVKTLDFRPQRR